jgi:hypothetical protein
MITAHFILSYSSILKLTAFLYCILIDVTYILDTVHHLRLKNLQCFGEWICLHLQIEKGEPTVVSPSRRARPVTETGSSEQAHQHVLPFPPESGDIYSPKCGGS